MANLTQAGEGGSQTLARGLTALTLIGEADPPLSVAQLAAQLGIHRSMAYRLVKTLEQQGFVERTPAGELEVGIRVAALARSVARDLQGAATPVLTEVANALDVTTFLVVYDGEAAVTLINVEPLRAETTLAQRPGSRHSIDRGAPGRVIRSQVRPVDYPPQPYEVSHDEIIPGIESIAVPVKLGDGRPAAIAVLYVPRPLDEAKIVAALTRAAAQIADAMR
jgi:DNA-binding IclR family transcriptional regulator